MASRRKFLSDCCAAAATFSVAPLILGLPKAAASQVEQPLNYAAFAGQLHTRFRVRLDSGSVVELQLIKARLAPPPRVVPGRRPPLDAENEKFSLIFTGPQAALLPSAIHAFEHAHLGRFDMHLGEIGQPEQGRVRYEAVFNQPVSPAMNLRA